MQCFLYRQPLLTVCCALQSSWPAGQYAAAVVTVHLAFALLEKQRLENFEERGEVHIVKLIFECAHVAPSPSRCHRPVLPL